MSEQLNIDFETESQVDLLKAGVYNYAKHPSTNILMMGWAFGDETPLCWYPGDTFPERIVNHVTAGGRINAANATFERLIWRLLTEKYAVCPAPALEQFYCTLYKARCNNLPASLDKLCRALGTFNQKQAARGKELIRLFCLLDEDTLAQVDRQSLTDDAMDALWSEFTDYCLDDVRAEREAARVLREPTQEEWEDYWVTERINDRGVIIDRELAVGAQRYAEEERQELVEEVKTLTEGEVEKTRGETLKRWVVERLNAHQCDLITVYKNDVKKMSLDAHNRQVLLAEDLPPVVRKVLECSDASQKSSIGKFKAMLLRADTETNRVHGALMANGASGTGRFSSKGLQVHNFPRQSLPEQDIAIEDICEGIMAEDICEYFGMPIMSILSRLLRPTLIAPKRYQFLVSDWRSIEARIAPWLARSSPSAEAKLQQFRDGINAYKEAAARTFDCNYDDVTPEQLQVGKVQELAFQFGGGANAFLIMARNKGVQASFDDAKYYRTRWRAANPWAPATWAALESAVHAAIRNPTKVQTVGRVRYFTVPKLYGFDQTLFCELPCGRVLTYPDIRITQELSPFGKMQNTLSALRAGWTPKVGEKEWPRGKLYGGLLFENIVQGTAASLLRYALRQCHAKDLPVVLHVHDEIVLEVPDSQVEDAQNALFEIMNTPPEWLKTSPPFPLEASVERMTRYGK